jgi:hypothetical protein
LIAAAGARSFSACRNCAPPWKSRWARATGSSARCALSVIAERSWPWARPVTRTCS